MAKGNYFKELQEIRILTNKMSNALNESLTFEDNYEDQELDDAQVPADPSFTTPEEDLDNEIDIIREIALKGMVKLCKTPEDSRYQFLKKVFSFCDKASESENEDTAPKK